MANNYKKGVATLKNQRELRRDIWIALPFSIAIYVVVLLIQKYSSMNAWYEFIIIIAKFVMVLIAIAVCICLPDLKYNYDERRKKAKARKSKIKAKSRT